MSLFFVLIFRPGRAGQAAVRALPAELGLGRRPGHGHVRVAAALRHLGERLRRQEEGQGEEEPGMEQGTTTETDRENNA